MFKDRLKSLLGGTAAGVAAAPGSQLAAPAAKDLKPSTRVSNGLDQFFASIRDQYALNIIDFAGANQNNISFITNLSHRLSSEDYLRSLEIAFGQGDFYENQADTERAEKFLEGSLQFEPETFDGALVWDSLQFLSPSLLQPTVDKLYDILRPNACLLAFFSADEKASQVPVYTYRIADQKNLLLTPRGHRKTAQFFNNRALEKLFSRFQSVKFFLTRDSLREIIVKR